MKYKPVKNTTLSLSVIGTGCWSFGGGVYWGKHDRQNADSVIRASVEHGINCFDTAEVYNEGRSELSLGLAIKGIPH